MHWSSAVVILGVMVGLSGAQHRVAPGVPPQHYDPNLVQQQQQYAQNHGHPPPPPQYQQQQVPVQHQQHQVPIQHQQVPVQHQQVPVQHQVPIQQGHGHGHGPPPHAQGQPGGPPPPGHGHGHGQQPILDTSNIGQERQHIQDHMDVPIDTSQMSEHELQFHYFKMHDADNNNKLDGCELVKSLIHWHDEANHDPKAGHPIPEAKVFKDDELMQMIDPILDNDDKNKDGFIDYVHEGAEEHANVVDDDQIAAVVDQVLDYDVNRDGMIDYAEFITAQNIAEKTQKKKKCESCGD